MAVSSDVWHHPSDVDYPDCLLPVTFHGLRHRHASVHVAAGMNAATISRIGPGLARRNLEHFYAQLFIKVETAAAPCDRTCSNPSGEEWQG